MFKGSLVALITPMREDGSVDEKAYAALVDWQIKEGTNGVVPVGTTGESPTLSHAEHRRVVEIALEVAKGRVPVIAGAGSNSTEEAIELTRHAKEAGADAALVVTPYYNKPTQEGMFLHFSAIADSVDLPIIIYNIPPRSVVDMSVETMARLAKHRNVDRREGCDGEPDASVAHSARLWGVVLPVVRGGSYRVGVQCSGRCGLHQRDGKRGASVVQRDADGMGRRAGGPGDGATEPAGAVARCAIQRDQSGAGEVRGLAAGHFVGTLPIAAGTYHGGRPGHA